MIAATAALALTLATQHCPARTTGPASLQHGGTAGASCLVAAFRHGCRPADYVLSQFGVDTIHSLTFRIERRATGCAVLVVESFRVVPQAPHVTGRFACRRLRPLVADRCTTNRTVSLTTLGS